MPSIASAIPGLAFAALLLAGGAGAEGPTATPLIPPVGAITFPPPSASDSRTLTLLGTATVSGADMPLKVNGIAATSTDRFATWAATVPLETGTNELRLTTRGGTVLATVLVEGVADLPFPWEVAFDANRNQVLAIGGWMGWWSIVRVDPETGAYAPLSTAKLPDTDNPFYLIGDADIEPSSQRLFVVDMPELPEPLRVQIASIDLATGRRSVVSPQFVSDYGTNMAIDAANQRALVVPFADPTQQLRGVAAVDFATGAHSVVAALPAPTDIAIDAPRNRAIVIDEGQLIAVDLMTGTRSDVPLDGATDLQPPLAIDDSRLTAYVGSPLTSVNLTTGARAPVPGSPPYVSGIAVDAAGNRLFAADALAGTITTVDLAAGTGRTLLRWHYRNDDARFGLGNQPALDDVSDRILMANSIHPQTASAISSIPAIVAIDPATGQRTVVASDAQSDGGESLESNSFAIAVDGNRGRALVTAFHSHRVLAVDLATGERTLFAEMPSNLRLHPEDIVIDHDRHRALVSATALSGITGAPIASDAIVEFDLNTGDGRVLSDAARPDATNPLIQPGQLALDSARNRLLVVDNKHRRIIGVDLATGRRSVVATSRNMVWDIAVDAARNRILLGLFTGDICALDIASGRLSLFAPRGDGETRWVLVDGDRIYSVASGLRQINPVNGESVILSR